MKKTVAGLGVALALAASVAHAGQHPFSFGYDTDVVPEGDVELEQWDWAWGATRNPQQPTDGQPLRNPSLYYLWWSPIVGLGEHLELAFPFQIVSNSSTASLDFISAEARWRLNPRTNDDWFQMLFRAAFVQNVISFTPPSLQADVISSVGDRRSLHAVLDLGVRGAVGSLEAPGNAYAPSTTNGQTYDFIVFTYDVGITYPLKEGEWQLGLEHYGVVGNANTWEFNPQLQFWPLYQYPQFYVGPDVAFTRGRFWFTAGCLVGLGRNSANVLPRFQWAVTL